MKSRLLVAAVLAALAILPLAPRARIHGDARGPQSLTALVGSKRLTRDTNGDGLPDVVAARVIVPADAALADVEAATNLAARLGYETTALTLPIVSYLMANVKYLRDGQYTVQRIEEDAARDAVSLT